jgi:hypothetical protein
MPSGLSTKAALAENVYRKALKIAPRYVDAAVNLSCLLCDTADIGMARDPAFQRISGDREDARLT